MAVAMARLDRQFQHRPPLVHLDQPHSQFLAGGIALPHRGGGLFRAFLRRHGHRP